VIALVTSAVSGAFWVSAPVVAMSDPIVGWALQVIEVSVHDPGTAKTWVGVVPEERLIRFSVAETGGPGSPETWKVRKLMIVEVPGLRCWSCVAAP
jgi:hypothetical protein